MERIIKKLLAYGLETENRIIEAGPNPYGNELKIAVDKTAHLMHPVKLPKDNLTIIDVGLEIVKLEGQKDHYVIHYHVIDNSRKKTWWTLIGEPLYFKEDKNLLGKIADEI